MATFEKLNDNRLVNIDKVAYIKYVELDKSEVLWDRVDTTAGIEYVLVDNAHYIERYETAEEAKEAFDALEYEGFVKMTGADIFVNKTYVKAIKQDLANELKVDYMVFNGMVQDVFETAEEATAAYKAAIKDFSGEDYEEPVEEPVEEEEEITYNGTTEETPVGIEG